MSHLLAYETNLKSLRYLQKVLNRLKINYYISGQNIILSQTKDKNFLFCWDNSKKCYSLFYDTDFWAEDLTVSSFIDRITRDYSSEEVADEMKNLGFSTESYENLENKNVPQTIKSKTLILGRFY